MGLGLAGVALKSLLPSGILSMVAATASSLLFSGTIFWVVGPKAFGDGPITRHKVSGAIVIYLNIAFTFAVLDHVLYRLVEQAYSGVEPSHSLGDLLYLQPVDADVQRLRRHPAAPSAGAQPGDPRGHRRPTLPVDHHGYADRTPRLVQTAQHKAAAQFQPRLLIEGHLRRRLLCRCSAACRTRRSPPRLRGNAVLLKPGDLGDLLVRSR
jgi:hypothetical protein